LVQRKQESDWVEVSNLDEVDHVKARRKAQARTEDSNVVLIPTTYN